MLEDPWFYIKAAYLVTGIILLLLPLRIALQERHALSREEAPCN